MRFRLRGLACAGVLIAVSAVTQVPSQAAAQAAAQAGDVCANATTQAAMNQCSAQNFKKADDALNTSYRAVQKRLAGQDGAKKQLVTAQRAWIAFRDAECSFVGSGTAGGSISGMMVSDCKTRLTKGRTTQLTNYLNCAEGDLSCPVPPAR